MVYFIFSLLNNSLNNIGKIYAAGDNNEYASTSQSASVTVPPGTYIVFAYAQFPTNNQYTCSLTNGFDKVQQTGNSDEWLRMSVASVKQAINTYTLEAKATSTCTLPSAIYQTTIRAIRIA